MTDTIRTTALASLLALATIGGAAAQSIETPVRETHDGRAYDGFLVRPETPDGRAVLIAHDFLGAGDNQRGMAQALAAAGMIVYVPDLYGSDRRPTDFESANAAALALREDVPGTRTRMRAALDRLLAEPGVEAARVAVIGTSVGVAAAMELARTGADVALVAGLWGILENRAPETAEPVRARVLMLHGDRDPLADEAARAAFLADLEAAGTAMEMIVYPGVAHAFTIPSVGTNVSSGFAYDEAATETAMGEIAAALGKL